MTEEIKFLSSLNSEFIEEGYWGPDSITIDEGNVTDSESLLIHGLKVATAKSTWFSRFQVQIPAGPGPMSDKNLIQFEDGPQLKVEELKGALKDKIKDPDDYAGQVQRHFSSQKYENAISDIQQGISGEDELALTLKIDKHSIVSEICTDWSFDGCSMEPQLWVNQSTLKNWIESVHVEEVIQTQFNSGSLPYHVFLEHEGEQSDYLGFVSIDSIRDEQAVHPSSCEAECEVANKSLSDLFSSTNSNKPSISPLIFDTTYVRNAYSDVFLSLSMMCLTEDCEIDRDTLNPKIITDRHHLKEEHNLGSNCSLYSSSEDLSNLYELLQDIHEKSSTISLAHWQRAVATQCSTFDDITSNRRAIVHYAGFLQEESAKEELEQLQSTVEEVSELTRTIANSLSEDSRELTSDLQNIVIALLGAIVTNFVLILRYSDFYVLAPFSVAAISGILIFYYPIVQNKIDNTHEVMENRTADFLIYLSEIRSHVGNRVFDLQKIERQHESHLETAAQALITTRKLIARVYILMVVLWFTVISYGYLVVTEVSEEWVISTLSDIGIQTTTSVGKDMISVTVIFSVFPAVWIIWKTWGKMDSASDILCTSQIPDNVEVELPEPTQDLTKKTIENNQVLDERYTEAYDLYYPFVPLLLLMLIILISLARITNTLGVW